jgi:hypothetical protein
MAVHTCSDAGLVLMLYYSRDRDEIFVRIAADDQHLRQVAEMRQYQLELKAQYLSAYAPYKNDFGGRRELNYTDHCMVSHLYKTHQDLAGEKEAYPQPGDIFRTVDRIRLIDYIVRNSDHNCAGLDVGQLMHDGDLLHYFPMHENRKLVELDDDWFKAFAWGTHIDKVRDYFGEKIALYFLFMSHLNKWLVPLTLFGIVFWILELVFQTSNVFISLVACLGIGVWTTLFIPFWRRATATHALKWGTYELTKQFEPTRPEFVGGPEASRINPVTGRIDRYYPWSERIKHVLCSYTVILFSIAILVFMIMLLFLFNRMVDFKGHGLFFMIINALVVESMNTIFTSFAKFLTDRENHRADSEYANHLMAKTVIFKFVNCYISLYYIAFFKKHGHLFGQEMECYHEDCLHDVGLQLAVFMIMRLTLQNFVELGVPYLLMAWRNYREGRQFHTSLFTNPLTVMPDMSSAEKQSKKEEYDIYEDMDEILILYGYTTLFVAACPWVPLLSLLYCLLECFLDQKKLVLLYRRPFPDTAANNEPWDTAFDVFGILAMLTNTALVVFSSSAFEEWDASTKILVFLIVEHSMLFTRFLISRALPETPHRVKLLEMQQQVMVHRHFNLGGDEDDSETRATAMLLNSNPAPHVFEQDNDDDDY